MQRWPVTWSGSPAGNVYATSGDEARRRARAAYKRVHPDRDPRGVVRVGDPSEIDSEPGEARQLVGEVYEGLRLLPGMEVPAEKLRSALVLLETAVARDPATARLVTRRGGGDTELLEALQPIFDAKVVPAPVQARLQGLLEWVGINTTADERQKIDIQVFQTLWEAGLVDLHQNDPPACPLHQASAYLVGRLRKTKVIEVERFKTLDTLKDFRKALKKMGGTSAGQSLWAFVPARSADRVEVRRPLVTFNGQILQPALLMRGVGVEEDEVAAFDAVLFETLELLRTWDEGLGRIADEHFEEKQRQFQKRTKVRIEGMRKQMATAKKEGRTILPASTARRDLIKFLIDQIHRLGDALALLPDSSLGQAFDDLVFKDVVFRSAGPYLSRHFGVSIDTEVVAGADSQALVGRFKKEPGGRKPTTRTTRIFSVVVPCYTQEGVAVRPASVRLGTY
ncbi:MAG: hypothetical protein JKY65_13250 [Planctomycetes bacterium]|nr:hypothetical protein [Planctomycetota bacterium]